MDTQDEAITKTLEMSVVDGAAQKEINAMFTHVPNDIRSHNVSQNVVEGTEEQQQRVQQCIHDHAWMVKQVVAATLTLEMSAIDGTTR